MHGTVRAALCTEMITIEPDALVSAAELLFVERRAPELYVVSPCGLLLGVLPDYEVLKLRLLGAPSAAARVADVMAVPAETATLDTPLGDVACRLRVNVHSRIPVVDSGRLVGYVTRHTVLAVLLECDENPESPTELTDMRPSRGRIRIPEPNFLRSARPAAVEPGV